MQSEYIRKILKARVYDLAVETPVCTAANLSKKLENNIIIKREDLQPVFSFKLRGAYNKISQLSEKEKAKGVVCASAGNHAQGVALSAQHMGLRAVIVMPTTTPDIKVKSVRTRGAEVILFGDTSGSGTPRTLANNVNCWRPVAKLPYMFVSFWSTAKILPYLGVHFVFSRF